MITETNKTIYKCEHCRKVYQRKDAAERHETKCKKNPENNRACFGCKFLEKILVSWSEDYCTDVGRMERERTLNVLFCAKKNLILTPPNKWEIDAGAVYSEAKEELSQEEMPKECELYKWEFSNK